MCWWTQNVKTWIEINLALVLILRFILLACLVVGKVYTECKMYTHNSLMNAAIIRHSSVYFETALANRHTFATYIAKCIISE